MNVDGVPVFKSTNSQCWPIQGLLDGHNFSEPFLIGLFYGNSKPKNLDFLGDFLVEFEQLKQSGLDYNGSNIKFDIVAKRHVMSRMLQFSERQKIAK